MTIESPTQRRAKAVSMIQEAIFSIFAFCKLIEFTPYGDQVEFLRRVEALTLNPKLTPKQIGVRAGTGVGKTACLVVILLWRTWRVKGTFSVNTAPTERQCREVFFAELSRVVGRSRYLSSLVTVKGARMIFDGYPKWQIFAATASNENAMRGLHHYNMTLGVEELTGIKGPVVSALLRSCSQGGNMFTAIFNPDEVVGLAYEMFHQKAEFWPWNMKIDKLSIAREAPHIVDPGLIEQWRQEYGEDSDFYRIGVLGDFPLGGGSNVIPLELVEKAYHHNPSSIIAQSKPCRVIAVDFARFGGDENVIVARSGNAVIRYEQFICDPNVSAARAREIARELGWQDDVLIVLDGVGIGQGMIHDFLEEDFMVQTFHPLSKTPVPGFANLLSASFFCLRTKLEREQVLLPDDPKLQSQLVTRNYRYRKGKIEVESKDDYKARGFSDSPDRADAIVMAFSDIADIQGTISDDVLPFLNNATRENLSFKEAAARYYAERTDRMFAEHHGRHR